jgi:hypothetical protein
MNTNKLRTFVSDKAMSEAVYDVIYRFFLKRRKTDDVQVLASERLALFLLEDAWRDLAKYGNEAKEKKDEGNVGL